MRGKKKLMIEALKAQLGVVTTAAKIVGIARRTHYDWLEKDSEYKQAYEEIEDITLDFAENALFKQMKEGNITSIIFFLKTKAKKRGYIERTDQYVEHSGKIDMDLDKLIKATRDGAGK